MSDDTRMPPAFPEARANKLKAVRSLWVIGVLGLIAIVGGAELVSRIMIHVDGISARPVQYFYTPWLIMASVFSAMIAGLWFCIRYWQSADERERQTALKAFFWGGGMLSWTILIPIISPLFLPDFKFAPLESLNISSTLAFGLGALAAIIVMCIGNTISGLFYWATKR
jgi:hypothetical protein